MGMLPFVARFFLNLRTVTSTAFKLFPLWMGSLYFSSRDFRQNKAFVNFRGYKVEERAIILPIDLLNLMAWLAVWGMFTFGVYTFYWHWAAFITVFKNGTTCMDQRPLTECLQMSKPLAFETAQRLGNVWFYEAAVVFGFNGSWEFW